MSFEWKHPNYYKEMKKLREESKDQQSEEPEDQEYLDKEDTQK
jgi:hypothetical protein|tara:strand:- start:2777 stop:2905 length:129 start_codon:yes stop_codon:yes gene_type:complete